MTGWQRRVAVFAQQHNLRHTPDTHTRGLVSEVSEIAQEVLLATDYGQHAPHFRLELAGEIGNALYSLLIPANICCVDADDVLSNTSQKYERRLTKHGVVG
ncbi:MAG: MazG-like family protein [Anaerolineae bacterium]|jgi:NTP pyrophosphatase (non-canonical NTP hydrolase)